MNSRLDYLDDKGHESIKKENKKLNIVCRTGIISSFYWIYDCFMLAYTYLMNVHSTVKHFFQTINSSFREY
jgi:hypothetical protein